MRNLPIVKNPVLEYEKINPQTKNKLQHSSSSRKVTKKKCCRVHSSFFNRGTLRYKNNESK